MAKQEIKKQKSNNRLKKQIIDLISFLYLSLLNLSVEGDVYLKKIILFCDEALYLRLCIVKVALKIWLNTNN